MRDRLPLIASLCGTVAAGCGPSLSTMIEQERWYEACEAVAGDSEPARREELSAALRARETTRVRVVAHTPAQLEELLPYVPGALRTGEITLLAVHAEAPAERVTALEVGASIVVGRRPHRWRSCCNSELEWAVVDDRLDEHVEAGRRQRRRGGSGGPFRELWRAAELAVGFAAGGLTDLLWVGTLGVLDLDASGFDGARASPLTGLRRLIREGRVTLGAGAADTARTEPEVEPEPTLEERRALTAGMLTSLTRDVFCRIDADHRSCVDYVLLAQDLPPFSQQEAWTRSGTPDVLDLTVVHDVPGPVVPCRFTAHAAVPLPDGESIAARMGAVFPDGSVALSELPLRGYDPERNAWLP